MKTFYADSWCNDPNNGLNHRDGHDGGGFLGTLVHDQTEVVMCCHADNNGGKPTYVTGSGPDFQHYKYAEANQNSYYGICYKSTLAAGDYTL